MFVEHEKTDSLRKNLYFGLRKLIKNYFKNYSEIPPKINGFKRNFVFTNVSVNLESIFIFVVSNDKEHFSES